jgi:hypothetical protein
MNLQKQLKTTVETTKQKDHTKPLIEEIFMEFENRFTTAGAWQVCMSMCVCARAESEKLFADNAINNQFLIQNSFFLSDPQLRISFRSFIHWNSVFFGTTILKISLFARLSLCIVAQKKCGKERNYAAKKKLSKMVDDRYEAFVEP